MFDPVDYTIAIQLFFKFLGVVYFFAFAAFIPQIKGLIGSNGILPASLYLDNLRHLGTKRFYYIPTLFWLNASDLALVSTTIVGTLLSILLILGIYPAFTLFLLYCLYFSIVSVGQDFLSFGWESLLLEITLNAFFLSLTSSPNIYIWISINLLLFRFHIQAGAIKILNGDINWRNLTATSYHYHTQPLPNTIAWYIHKFPLWFHKMGVLVTYFIELVIPFLLFFDSEWIRLIVYFSFVGLQFLIWFTGNFSFLNHLTVTLCTILIGNSFLSPYLNPPALDPSSLIISIPLSLIGLLLIAIHVMNLWNYFLPTKRYFKTVQKWIAPLHLTNRFGIFASMTTKRYEVIIEGSDDAQNWKEYCFKYKPSELDRRPRWVAPFQPRIDWQAWFLPFSPSNNKIWFQNFLMRLLLGQPEVLKLLRVNPFPNKPPKYIRAQLYDYEYTDRVTKKKTGCWWNRKLIRAYTPTYSLKNTQK